MYRVTLGYQCPLRCTREWADILSPPLQRKTFQGASPRSSSSHPSPCIILRMEHKIKHRTSCLTSPFHEIPEEKSLFLFIRWEMIKESEGGSKRDLLTLGGGGAEAAHISSSFPRNIGVFLAGNLSSGFAQMNASRNTACCSRNSKMS